MGLASGSPLFLNAPHANARHSRLMGSKGSKSHQSHQSHKQTSIQLRSQIKDLYSAGFLTPVNLFYVRNHGAVPKINKEMVENWVL